MGHTRRSPMAGAHPEGGSLGGLPWGWDGGESSPGGFPGRQGLSRPTRSWETNRAKRSPSSMSVCCRTCRLQSPCGGSARGASGAAPGGGVSRGQSPAAAKRGKGSPEGLGEGGPPSAPHCPPLTLRVAVHALSGRSPRILLVADSVWGCVEVRSQRGGLGAALLPHLHGAHG